MSRRSARSLAAGTGERSSSRRASRESAVASETFTLISFRSEIARSRSRSRGTSGDSVMISIENPASELKGPLCRLIGVRSGSDNQRLAGHERGFERACKHYFHLGFNQNLF